MPSGRASVSSGSVSVLTAFLAVLLPAGAQSVISTHAGVIHFFEGNVYLGDQALEAHLGKFPGDPARRGIAHGRRPGGSAAHARRFPPHGRAERDSHGCQRSRGHASRVADGVGGRGFWRTKSEYVGHVIYKDWKVHFVQKGVYRMDADPPRLSVQQGQAEVSSAAGEPVSVEQGMTLPFAGVLVTERSNEPGRQGRAQRLVQRTQRLDFRRQCDHRAARPGPRCDGGRSERLHLLPDARRAFRRPEFARRFSGPL